MCVKTLADDERGNLRVKVLASGSRANSYAFCDGKVTILLECGLPYHKTLNLLNWKMPDAALITHEHSDHARSVKGFLQRGVDVFMTAGTAAALKLGERHNLHTFKPFETFDICGHKVSAIPVKHDAAEPVCFVLDNEILFITDAGEVPDICGKFRTVLIEANYDLMRLNFADIGERQRQRILDNHLSIAQTKTFLRTLDEPEEVWLIHLSMRHADAKEFVRAVKLSTGFAKVKI